MYTLDRRHQAVILVLAAVLLFGGGYKYAQLRSMKVEEQELVVEESAVQEEEKGPAEVVVHVAGAVERPGVYRLPTGSRVADAVALAVPREDALLDLLNLAELLTDQKKIVVLGEGDLEKMQSGELAGLAASGRSVLDSGTGKININTAGQAELETLPGIGPSLAQRIIEYRETNGPFLTVEDIKNVSGIGDKRYEQIEGMICTN